MIFFIICCFLSWRSAIPYIGFVRFLFFFFLVELINISQWDIEAQWECGEFRGAQHCQPLTDTEITWSDEIKRITIKKKSKLLLDMIFFFLQKCLMLWLWVNFQISIHIYTKWLFHWYSVIKISFGMPWCTHHLNTLTVTYTYKTLSCIWSGSNIKGYLLFQLLENVIVKKKNKPIWVRTKSTNINKHWSKYMNSFSK